MKNLLPIIISLSSCSSPQNKIAPTKSTPIDSTTALAKPDSFRLLGKLSTTGDFNGDGKQDTLYQRNFSRLTSADIDSIPMFPDPDGYFKLQAWLREQQSEVYLVMNEPAIDTIHLDAGFGLYCLLNLGDVNKDGKDELAFVVDYPDQSNINTCCIYSICHGKWTELQYFSINENSFNWSTEMKPTFVDIKDYLEKRNGVWYYIDHQKMMVGDRPEDSEMKPLRVAICK